MTTGERTEFDAASAESILRKACDVAHVDPDGIEMQRFGDHAVFRIDCGRIISRVGRSPDRLPSVRREVAVAQWLAAEGYPAARLVTEAEQPVVVDGHPVTFWEGLADGDTYASTREMGELLRRLHKLEPPTLSLPELRPFDKVNQRLQCAAIPSDTRAYLASLADELASEYDRLAFALPTGHLHGDFNVGNVLRDAAGHPKVIDLDGFVIGPREWDLMQTAMYYDSFGWHTETEYADFVDGYGFDVRQWPGYAVLRSVRELLMVTWLSQNAGTNPRAAEEVEKRVETLRSGGSRRDWAPF
ncbi:phosphotransferase enzyme family protein [Streptomyces coeruleorubidus]|uniref:Aminoglycoside phosphotransferase family protein n=1 Tax=Streptomyces coeruleorubidus TaxID=116188 RepID=A0ABZ0K8F6_STRC4|nr:aminoglycoside phosphotransferase family protein [Streptomyces coeruleorubidus]WOT34258.1 aminoglycoside phosphotransferase family protein [Streptomyces coeruleorubidus]WOT34286.1 aminoglycoside phosphotransferase family protein [Streptomyces coeruleorubidus]WOT34310.1 aminoglycoside phosphotransferase family protein [Streptomyces coeruleorubidus]